MLVFEYGTSANEIFTFQEMKEGSKTLELQEFEGLH